MKFPVLWSGLCCYTEGWGGKCSEILAMIKLLYNPRVNKVFTSLFTIGEILVKFFFFFFLQVPGPCMWLSPKTCKKKNKTNISPIQTNYIS